MKTMWLFVIVLVVGSVAEAQTIKVPESWNQLAAKADEVANINLDRKMLKFAAVHGNGWGQ